MKYDSSMVYEYKSVPYNTDVCGDFDRWLNTEAIDGWRLHSILQETTTTYPVFIFERLKQETKERNG
jgi:hypothetical protein